MKGACRSYCERHSVSKEEREAHEVTHTPYRSWCPYCVRGRGRNAPHKSQGEKRQQSNVPRIALDYFFMSSMDEVASKSPILVGLDETTGGKYARAVGQKGLGREGELDWLINGATLAGRQGMSSSRQMASGPLQQSVRP